MFALSKKWQPVEARASYKKQKEATMIRGHKKVRNALSAIETDVLNMQLQSFGVVFSKEEMIRRVTFQEGVLPLVSSHAVESARGPADCCGWVGGDLMGAAGERQRRLPTISPVETNRLRPIRIQ
jgi:hypothetical protein